MGGGAVTSRFCLIKMVEGGSNKTRVEGGSTSPRFELAGQKKRNNINHSVRAKKMDCKKLLHWPFHGETKNGVIFDHLSDPGGLKHLLFTRNTGSQTTLPRPLIGPSQEVVQGSREKVAPCQQLASPCQLAIPPSPITFGGGGGQGVGNF